MCTYLYTHEIVDDKSDTRWQLVVRMLYDDVFIHSQGKNACCRLALKSSSYTRLVEKLAMVQEISNRTYWTDPQPWVSNSSTNLHRGPLVRSYSIFDGYGVFMKFSFVFLFRFFSSDDHGLLWASERHLSDDGVAKIALKALIDFLFSRKVLKIKSTTPG